MAAGDKQIQTSLSPARSFTAPDTADFLALRTENASLLAPMMPAANRAPLRQAHFDPTNVLSVSSSISLSAPESLFDPASTGLKDRAGMAIDAVEKRLPDAAGVDV